MLPVVMPVSNRPVSGPHGPGARSEYPALTAVLNDYSRDLQMSHFSGKRVGDRSNARAILVRLHQNLDTIIILVAPLGHRRCHMIIGPLAQYANPTQVNTA